MKIDDKFFKEMCLERLPTSVQTILASGSDDLEISKLAEMADRMMEVERLSSPTIAQVSQPLNVSTSDLAELKTQIAQLSATVAALQLRRSPGPSRRSFGRDHRRSRSRPRTANLCWYHVNYGDKRLRCVPPCSFKSTQGNSLAGDRDVEEHLHHLTLLFDRFQQFGVTLHPSKCVLGATSLEFLGHLIDLNGIRTLPSKVAAIRDFPPPTSKRQLQRFLGMVNFYRRFLPNCADLMLPLTNMLSGPKGPLELIGEALTAFERIKHSLADATLLTHPAPEAQLSLMVDASTVALLPAETRYSTFGRELLAIYLAVKHFRHSLEGSDFTVFTDHKPLTFALRSHTDKLNLREIRQLDYISQFTTDIDHIDGSRNEVADALSRPSIAHLQLSPGINLAEMAAEQRRVGPPCDEDVSGLQLQELPLTTGNGTILCDVSTPSHRPFVPPSLRRKVFSSLHNLSHPGSRATDKLVSDRFVWPGMHKDLKAWTRACIACQRSKVQRHNKAPIGTFPGPGSRFSHVHLDIVGPLPLSNGCSYLLTCVDRFTRWPEAIPLPDIAAPTVVKAFLSRWVAIFGAPSTITTERGAQFESNLFQSLLSFLG
nr:unnamed protein product [Spirometra erinaceieuropaei]